MAKNTQLLRFAKYGSSAIYGIGLHNERGRKNSASYSNKAIKPEFSKENLSWFSFDSPPFKERIEGILNQNGITKENNGGRKMRKDANLFCEFVVGATSDFFGDWKPGDKLNQTQLDYFCDAFEFLCDLVGGKQNVFSAIIHLDETNPHMHFCFVPIVADKKTGNKKLSAHDLCEGGKVTFAKWHTDFNEKVGKKYGLARGSVKSQKKYVQKIEDFKAQKAAELDKLMREKYQSKPLLRRIKETISGESGLRIAELENRLESAQNALETQSLENQGLRDHISLLEQENQRLQSENYQQSLDFQARQKIKDAQIQDFQNFQAEITLLGGVPWDDFRAQVAKDAAERRNELDAQKGRGR